MDKATSTSSGNEPAVDLVVYVGPTLPAKTAAELVPGARVRPPLARGDLYRDREAGSAVFVILDGELGRRCVSTREVIDVARDNALVIGAAGMGALRAAECWPVGVRGAGLIYRLLRRGILDSDDEVLVSTDRDDGSRALSVALINIRYAARLALRRQLVDAEAARRIVDVATRTPYAERQWRTLLRRAGVDDSSRELEQFCAGHDVQRRDGLAALEYAGQLLQADGVIDKHRRTSAEPFERPNREPRDLYFGNSPEVLRGELLEWLFGTGRYQKYLWALLAHRDEFTGLAREGRAGRLREVLCQVLGPLLADADFAAMLWEELDFLGELHAEIARMYAAKRLARQTRSVSNVAGQVLDRVREEVAIDHGASGWAVLVECVADGRLWGAIPFSWVERSCEVITQARCFRDSPK